MPLVPAILTNQQYFRFQTSTAPQVHSSFTRNGNTWYANVCVCKTQIAVMFHNVQRYMCMLTNTNTQVEPGRNTTLSAGRSSAGTGFHFSWEIRYTPRGARSAMEVAANSLGDGSGDAVVVFPSAGIWYNISLSAKSDDDKITSCTGKAIGKYVRREVLQPIHSYLSSPARSTHHPRCFRLARTIQTNLTCLH